MRSIGAHDDPTRGPGPATGRDLLLAAAAALVGAALIVLPAGAQDDPSLDLDLARPLPAPQETLLMLDGGRPLALGRARMSLTLLGGHGLARYTGDRDLEIRIDDVFTAAVGAGFGLGAGDLGVVMPLNLLVAGTTDGESWRATAAGDLTVVPRVSPLPATEGPVALILAVPLTVPTGQVARFSGRGGFSAEPQATLVLSAGRVVLALRPGILLQGGHDTTRPYRSDWLTMRAAVGVAVGPSRAVRVEIGGDGLLPVDRPGAASAEVLLGLVARPLPGLSLSLHGGGGFGPMPGVASARVVGAVAWTMGNDRDPGRTDDEGA